MSDDKNRALKVFLCHASSDKPAIQKLYSRLVGDGIDAWLDKEKLLPGQHWQTEIPKAVKNSDVVIVCLSSQSINKEGFVQKEIKIALDIADEKPEGTIFIIPARLEECGVPERLTQFHWVDLFSENGYQWLLRALHTRADTIGASFDFVLNGEVIIDQRIVISKLFSETKVGTIIKEISNQIHHHYNDDNFTILAIDMGGLSFAHQILSELNRLGRTNIPSVVLFTERIRESKTSIQIRIEPSETHLVSDRHIIIVDDLVSSGYTLDSAFHLCKEFGAKSIHACILLDAPTKRKVPNLQIYFKGLSTAEVGNFVGCGMDIQGECRELPFIGVVKSYNPPKLK